MTREPGVHLIVAGMEYERIVAPMFGEYPAKRIIILRGETEKTYPEAQRQADHFVGKIQNLPIEVETRDCDIYNFDRVLDMVSRTISEETEKGNKMYINVSSAPHLAYSAMIAASYFSRNPDMVEIFYSVPNHYVMYELMSELNRSMQENPESIPGNIGKLAQEYFEKGCAHTIEAFEEIPLFPLEELTELDYNILEVLSDKKERGIESIEKLVKELNSRIDKATGRPSVQYRLNKLESAKIIRKEQVQKKQRLTITKSGLIYLNEKSHHK